jgi:hypothetical protein
MMELAFFVFGFVAGAFAGMWYACRAIRAGAAPTVESVVARGGGSGEEDPKP